MATYDDYDTGKIAPLPPQQDVRVDPNCGQSPTAADRAPSGSPSGPAQADYRRDPFYGGFPQSPGLDHGIMGYDLAEDAHDYNQLGLGTPISIFGWSEG